MLLGMAASSLTTSFSSPEDLNKIRIDLIRTNSVPIFEAIPQTSALSLVCCNNDLPIDREAYLLVSPGSPIPFNHATSRPSINASTSGSVRITVMVNHGQQFIGGDENDVASFLPGARLATT